MVFKLRKSLGYLIFCFFSAPLLSAQPPTGETIVLERDKPVEQSMSAAEKFLYRLDLREKLAKIPDNMATVDVANGDHAKAEIHGLKALPMSLRAIAVREKTQDAFYPEVGGSCRRRIFFDRR